MEEKFSSYIYPDFTKDELRRKIKSNPSSPFLPMNTRSDLFDWQVVVGNVLGAMLKKRIGKYTYDQFREDAHQAFKELLESDAGWEVLNKAYFEKKNVFNISPEFLMFYASKQRGTSARVSRFYSDLLGPERIDFTNDHLNFLEKILAQTLEEHLEGVASLKGEHTPAYLPYMAFLFKKDIQWLANHSQSFLREIQNFLSFYGFLYAAQLGLSILSLGSADEPVSKPLYFILESEKASLERTRVQEYGYKSYWEGAKKIFPVLTMNEMLQMNSPQSIPMWQLIQRYEQNPNREQIVSELNSFMDFFISERELEDQYEPVEDVSGVIKALCKLSERQFTDKRSGKSGVESKYASGIGLYFGKPFIQSRGRVGKVLILSHDIVLLLTNLAIGNNDKMRFCDVMKEFQARGVYLDKQSEQELIGFYERIGNVERLSDSGDAVYVCKTF